MDNSRYNTAKLPVVQTTILSSSSGANILYLEEKKEHFLAYPLQSQAGAKSKCHRERYASLDKVISMKEELVAAHVWKSAILGGMRVRSRFRYGKRTKKDDISGSRGGGRRDPVVGICTEAEVAKSCLSECVEVTSQSPTAPTSNLGHATIRTPSPHRNGHRSKFVHVGI